MFQISFPFWIIIPSNPQPDVGCDAPGHVAIFSSAARAIAFMEVQKVGQWEVRLVSRTSRPEIAEFIRRYGIEKVCHDQNADGSGGTSLTSEELLAAWEL